MKSNGWWWWFCKFVNFVHCSSEKKQVPLLLLWIFARQRAVLHQENRAGNWEMRYNLEEIRLKWANGWISDKAIVKLMARWGDLASHCPLQGSPGLCGLWLPSVLSQGVTSEQNFFPGPLLDKLRDSLGGMHSTEGGDKRVLFLFF